MTFDSLGLAPEYLRAVADEGYTEPTPVQHQAIPLVLAGRDLLARAQTGTGKTAAFVLPILQLLHATDPEAAAAPTPGTTQARVIRRAVRALVLAPTRELAVQVEHSVRTYGRHHPMRSVAIYGGVGFDPQARLLRAGTPIVVATPGRLLDHVGQRTIDLSRVEIVVLDEADRMLDMGFIRDIRRILALLPRERQSLLFSATFSDDIRELAESLLVDPATVDVAPQKTTAELVDQVVVPVDKERKRELLTHLVRSGRIGQALVFTRTKHGANRLAEQLGRDGINAAAIHGNKSQGQRMRALGDFKSGRADVLVATDIAARGIDIEALPHVVNFELPTVAADYVHRIGRTGRAGVGGEAVSLVSADEAGLLHDIQRLLRRELPSETVHGFEPARSIRPQPVHDGRGRDRRGGRPEVRRGAPKPIGVPVGIGRHGGRDGGPKPIGAAAASGWHPDGRRDEGRGHGGPGSRPTRSPGSHAWRAAPSHGGGRPVEGTRGSGQDRRHDEMTKPTRHEGERRSAEAGRTRHGEARPWRGGHTRGDRT